MTYIRNIKTLQIRLIKYLVSKNVKEKCNKDYDKLFPICKILPVDVKVKYLIGLEHYYSDEYKIKKNNKYQTRSVRQKKYVQQTAKNYYGERVSKYIVPKIFNKIDVLRQEPKISKALLKTKLKNFLLDNTL